MSVGSIAVGVASCLLFALFGLRSNGKFEGRAQEQRALLNVIL